MAENDIPLIYLLNLEDDVQEKLKGKFNSHNVKLNGCESFKVKKEPLYLFYEHEIPPNLHEAEVIIINTEPCKGFVDIRYDSPNLRYYFGHTPNSVNFLPVDIGIIESSLDRANNKKQCVIIFCDSFVEATYNYITEENMYGKYADKNTYNNIPIIRKFFNQNKTGFRFNVPTELEDKDITNCISKYLSNARYETVFNAYSNSGKTLLVNDNDDVVSMVLKRNNTFFIFLPLIDRKLELLDDLLSNVLPEHLDFKDLFPNHGSFSWTSDFSYISNEEKNKIIETTREKERHEVKLSELNKEFEDIHLKPENIKLRNILKETDNELVDSVKWFFEYIGFENIENPDDEVDQDNGDVFEEDLRIALPDMTFIIEVKGIGGTSTDDQCAQVSKIVNRRSKADRSHSYHGIYIVNHQRFKAPKIRQNPPFNDRQIEDAEIAKRGMTYTYELFNVYHMIEAGILEKSAVKDAFLHEGLINFRESLHPLKFNHCYKGASVYSFNMDESNDISIAKEDKIAIQDSEEHWHLVDIESIEVNRETQDSVSTGLAGVKVSHLVEHARDYYVIKN